jgi:hypothetical protein
MQAPGFLLFLGGIGAFGYRADPVVGMLLAGVGLGLLVLTNRAAYSYRCSGCQAKAPNKRADRCVGCGEPFGDD